MAVLSASSVGATERLKCALIKSVNLTIGVVNAKFSHLLEP